MDRPTGRPVLRYGSARSGELVHVGIRRLGNNLNGANQKWARL
ncbi:hypothetical protein ACWGQ5_23025 [Streptomyces sp. NPDC055722]